MGPNLERTSNSASRCIGRRMHTSDVAGPGFECLPNDAAVNNTTRSADHKS